MRSRFVWAVLIVAMVSGPISAAPVMAQTTPSQEAAQLLAQYPNGGEGLANAIEQAMLASDDPVALAQALVALSAAANMQQQAAIGAGLGRAQAQFAAQGNMVVANGIGSAVAGAPDSVQTAFSAGGGAITVAGPAPGGGTTGGGTGAGSDVTSVN